MEDLGDVTENFVEFFRCIEKNSNVVPPPSRTFPPPDHGNLLASSSRYGHLFVAIGEHIVVHSLAYLRDRAPALPVARVDLKPHNVSSIKSIALALDDSALVVHAVAETSADGFVLVLHSSALVQGTAILLPSPPEEMQLRSVAVRPQGYDLDSETSSQFVALLSAMGEVELYSLTGDSASGMSSANFERGLAGPDPLTCVALSPDDEMVAVGSMRGSVAVRATEDMTLLTTIVEVESGWHPFVLQFLDIEALLVSYACGESVSHIVWNLVNEDGELVVKGHSPLGELCLASLPSRPASEDGDEEAENEDEYKPPVIWCSRIPGWDMCVVASSLSTDVEVISLNDDGLWENWKFDEGKSPTLPTDTNDNDTKPVGLAFDLTDTATIESPEPSAPRINPMPRLITFTTDSHLLPFSLIDDRPGAVCDLVRKSLPLPPVPSVNRPIEKVTFPALETHDDDTDSGSQELKSKTASLDGSPLVESAEGKTASSSLGSGSSDPPGWKGLATNADVSPEKGASFVEATYPPLNSPPETQPNSFSRKRQAADTSTSSRDSASSQDSVTDDEDLDEAVTDSVNDNSEVLQLPQTGFSGQEGLLSAFEYAGISERQSGGSDGSTFATSSVRFTSSAQPKVGTGLFSASKQTTRTSTVSTVSTPAYPPPPSLEDASAALKSGKPLDLIRSVLLEMAEELNNNREVEKATINTLHESNSAIMPLVESVRSGLADILKVLRDRFRHEATLRREVLGSLKRMMTLSREYESTSLEFRVREEEGFTSHLQAEDKAVDEQIAKKEAEVLMSISAIEDRLNADRIPKDRKVNQSEQIQQMHSSLSLQGIRMRKVHGLLTALSERIDELDKGGRRTDLGLSMARLERLSISNGPRTTDERGSGMRQNVVHAEAERNFKKSFGAATEMPGNFEGTSISSDVQKVLRRLAMRGGRANIYVKAPPKRKGFTAAAQGKERGLTMTRGPGSDALFSSRKDTGDVIDISDNSGQSFTQVGIIQDTSGYSYDAVDKSAYAVPSASFTDVNRSGQPNASAGISFSSSKRSTFSVEGTVTKKNEGWSTTLRGGPIPAGSNKSVPNNCGRAPTVATDPKPKDPMFDFLPPGDFRGKKTAFPASQPEANMPSLTSAEVGSDTSAGNVWRQTELSRSLVGSSLPDQPSLGSARQKRTVDSESFSFASHDKTDIPKKHEKPPIVPTKSSIYASLPPDSFAVDSHTSAGQALGSPAPPSDDKSSGLVAFLPPDESVKGDSVSTLPRDDNKKSTPPPASPGAGKRGLVATLPPDGDVHVGQVASLPPDDDLKKDLVATFPPDDDRKGSDVAAILSDDTAKNGNVATLPPEDELKTSLVARLPPDDDIVAASSLKKRPTESVSSPSDGKPAQGLQGQASSATSNADSNPFSMFGRKLSIGGTESASQFGSKENQNRSKSEESKGISSVFGSAATQSQPSQFPFGAGQVNKAVESGSVREPTSDILAGSSEDSDAEENSRSTGGFGMDTTAMTSNVSRQSAFAGFGSQFQSDQNASSSSGFGQTGAGVFGDASANSAPFGASSMQDSQGMSFGASSAQATNGASFGSFGGSSSSFASPSPFGATTQFGASSTLGSGTPYGSDAQGGGSQFGGASQLGGGAQFGASSQGSQFGASSQLGVGFGAQSQLGGGASPFGGQGGSGATGFGGGASGFGGGVPAAKFGESSFGTPQQSAFGSTGGGGFDGGGVSPFGAMSGAMFGGQSGGGSGFAALAASQPFGGSAGSGFGTGTTPVFGNNSGPPSFTSAAFAQRRA